LDKRRGHDAHVRRQEKSSVLTALTLAGAYRHLYLSSDDYCLLTMAYSSWGTIFHAT
jgi:hypothetical protein